MQGKFITIEGCEGVGKSTQLALLKEYFENNGIEAVFTREPGGTDIAEKIRGIILDANNKALTPVTELLLYAAARRQHTEEKIIKALKEGKVVVCDRYADSTVAYQGYARNLDKQLINQLNDIAMANVKIDLTLFLDLPPELGFARKGGADKNDRLENEKLDFHKRVYEGYLAVAQQNQDRVVKIDSSQSVEGVFSQIVDAMKKAGIV
ncbi:MAG: dTMP kinase [Clostridiales bacterium]|nr:dTMP kinase [Clostridiales bacterium]